MPLIGRNWPLNFPLWTTPEFVSLFKRDPSSRYPPKKVNFKSTPLFVVRFWDENKREFEELEQIILCLLPLPQLLRLDSFLGSSYLLILVKTEINIGWKRELDTRVDVDAFCHFRVLGEL